MRRLFLGIHGQFSQTGLLFQELMLYGYRIFHVFLETSSMSYIYFTFRCQGRIQDFEKGGGGPGNC